MVKRAAQDSGLHLVHTNHTEGIWMHGRAAGPWPNPAAVTHERATAGSGVKLHHPILNLIGIYGECSPENTLECYGAYSKKELLYPEMYSGEHSSNQK